MIPSSDPRDTAPLSAVAAPSAVAPQDPTSPAFTPSTTGSGGPSNGGGGLSLALELPDDQLAALEERIAGRVLERVNAAIPERLLTVDQLAEMLTTTPEWVRRHQAELGAFRLSNGGGRNPIRFRLSDVERFLEARRLKPPRSTRRGADWRSDPDWALR